MMRTFIDYTVSAKTNACYMFTAILFFYALGDLFLPGGGLSGLTILEIMLLSMVCGALQVLVFSDLLLKRMGCAGRTVLLGVVLLAPATGFALLCGWFPADRVEGWLGFLGIFLLVFLGVTVGFEILFRITGRRYTDLLTERQGEKR